jgi:hypothetical protein
MMNKTKSRMAAKKIFLQIVLPLLIISAAILSIGTSCGPGPTPPAASTTCDSTATKFMALYNAHPPANNVSIDLQVHEYTFKSSVAGNICAVGYQGVSTLVAGNYYKIEIIDVAGSVVLNTGTYQFGSTVRNYKVFPAPVSIAANALYTVRRTVVNNLGNVVNTVGNYKNVGPILPLVNGNLTITSTKAYDFYSGTATSVNTNGILPCIDIVLN